MGRSDPIAWILSGILVLSAGAPAAGQNKPTLDPGRTRTELAAFAEWYYFSGGSGLSSDEVIPGFTFTRYKEVYPWAGGVALRRTGASAPAGVSIGLRYAPMSLDLEEGDAVFGNLKLQPILADLRLDIGFSPGGMAPPSNGNGARAFLGIGAGWTSAAFTTGPFLADLESSTGVGYAVEAKGGFILEGDAGVMILLHPVTLTVFGGYIHVPGGIKTTWTASGPGGALILDDLDRLTVSSVKIGVSLGLTLLRSR